MKYIENFAYITLFFKIWSSGEKVDFGLSLKCNQIFQMGWHISRLYSKPYGTNFKLFDASDNPPYKNWKVFRPPLPNLLTWWVFTNNWNSICHFIHCNQWSLGYMISNIFKSDCEWKGWKNGCHRQNSQFSPSKHKNSKPFAKT